jgi:hypothetical protein
MNKRHTGRFREAILMLLFALWSAVSWAQAQSSYANLYYMQEEELNKRRSLQVLDDSLFGDKVNLQDGSIAFEQTDISIPLNGGRQLTLGRRMAQGKFIAGPSSP